MLFKRDPEKHFKLGLKKIQSWQLKDSANSFRKAWKAGYSEECYGYSLYAHLLNDDYGAVAKGLKKNTDWKDYSWYSLYWYRFMTGDIAATHSCIDKMLATDNYFLRAFALKELLKKGKLKDVPGAIKKYLLGGRLSNNFLYEKYRSEIYINLFHKRYKTALTQVKWLIKENPRFNEFYLDLIDVVSISKNAQVIKTFVTDPAVKLKASKSFRLLYQISRELYKLGMYNESEICMNNLLKEFEHNPLFHYNMANIANSKNDHAKAAKHYKMAIQISPAFERAYFNLGRLYQKNGYLADAIHAYEEALKIKKCPDTLYNLTAAQIETKQLVEAFQSLKKLNTTPEYANEAVQIERQIKEVLVLS